MPGYLPSEDDLKWYEAQMKQGEVKTFNNGFKSVGEVDLNSRNISNVEDAIELTLRKQGIPVTKENINMVKQRIREGDISSITRDQGARQFVEQYLATDIKTIDDAIDYTLKTHRPGGGYTTEQYRQFIVDRLNKGDYSVITSENGARQLVQDLMSQSSEHISSKGITDANVSKEIQDQIAEAKRWSRKGTTRLIEVDSLGDLPDNFLEGFEHPEVVMVRERGGQIYDYNYLKTNEELKKIYNNANLSQLEKEIEYSKLYPHNSHIIHANSLDELPADFLDGFEHPERISIELTDGTKFTSKEFKEYINNSKLDEGKTARAKSMKDYFSPVGDLDEVSGTSAKTKARVAGDLNEVPAPSKLKGDLISGKAEGSTKAKVAGDLDEVPAPSKLKGDLVSGKAEGSTKARATGGLDEGSITKVKNAKDYFTSGGDLDETSKVGKSFKPVGDLDEVSGTSSGAKTKPNTNTMEGLSVEEKIAEKRLKMYGHDGPSRTLSEWGTMRTLDKTDAGVVGRKGAIVEVGKLDDLPNTFLDDLEIFEDGKIGLEVRDKSGNKYDYNDIKAYAESRKNGGSGTSAKAIVTEELKDTLNETKTESLRRICKEAHVAFMEKNEREYTEAGKTKEFLNEQLEKVKIYNEKEWKSFSEEYGLTDDYQRI